MKTLRMLSVAALVVSGWITSFGQNTNAEVPGDNFSLEGALELFKKSSSPEEFEKMLNSPDSKVNNLDLNGDGYIDYVRVLDRNDGDVHAFILQAVVTENELQDIAVIELEKQANGKAVLQIIGDEDIYGVTTIIEPTREVRTYAGAQTTRTVVNVWAWPSVQYVYGPRYTVWVSPWGWHRRPVWYHSWRPIAYVHYHPIWRPYYHHYAVCHTRRVVHAHRIYHPHRRSSVIVHRRHNDQIARYRSSHQEDYRNGYRSDDRRSYARNDRSRTVNATTDARSEGRTRTTTQRNANIEPTRSVSRERTTTPDARTSTNQTRRDLSEQSNVNTRRQVTTSSPATSNQQRTSTPERRSTTIQRNSTDGNRDNLVRSKSQTTQRSRSIPQNVQAQPQRSTTPKAQVRPQRSAPQKSMRSASPERRSSASPAPQRSSGGAGKARTVRGRQ